MSTIYGITGLSTAGATASQTKQTSDIMGKDDFLKMLVTQLQNQDPLQPMEDKEFIAQMAQFSSLEQMQNMTAAMTATQATNMIGKAVSWKNDDNVEKSGTVESVRIIDGQAKLVIGQTIVTMDKVVEIKTA